MSQDLLFIVFRGLKIQMKVEGNSNKFHPKVAPNEALWLVLYAHPIYGLSRLALENLEVLETLNLPRLVF